MDLGLGVAKKCPKPPALLKSAKNLTISVRFGRSSCKSSGWSRPPTKLVTALLITLIVTPVVAAPGEVQNLRWSSKTVMGWDNVSNALAYHLYGGDLTGLPGNAGCLLGNNRSESLGSDETVGVGQVRFYVVDGDYPLRNPSMLVQHSRRETTGVFLHTGEFFLAASDMTIPGRHLDWALERTYRSQVHYDGPLGHNWDFNLNARLTPLGTDVRHHDGSGRVEIFGRIDSTHFASPPGRYAVLIENPDDQRFIALQSAGEDQVAEDREHLNFIFNWFTELHQAP